VARLALRFFLLPSGRRHYGDSPKRAQPMTRAPDLRGQSGLWEVVRPDAFMSSRRNFGVGDLEARSERRSNGTLPPRSERHTANIEERRGYSSTSRSSAHRSRSLRRRAPNIALLTKNVQRAMQRSVHDAAKVVVAAGRRPLRASKWLADLSYARCRDDC
jgi:hypothetical protein